MVGGGLTAVRNMRIDGLRAFAVLGVMWHHWAPRSWKGHFPFEIGLFFFLTLTGFLVTRILLRARDEACAQRNGNIFTLAEAGTGMRQTIRIGSSAASGSTRHRSKASPCGYRSRRPTDPPS